MKASTNYRPTFTRGSALITVIFLIFMMSLLTGSMLEYTLGERRGNVRNRLIQRTKNMSENISLYAAEQITTKLYRRRSTTPVKFMTGENALALPPAAILQTIDSTYVDGANSMEVRAGLTSSTGLKFIDPAIDPNDANAGLQVNTAKVPVVSKATAYLEALGRITAYTQHDLALDFVPLFQFAAFYNMDLEMYPGDNMSLSGPIHVNGEMNARTGSNGEITFWDRVSVSKGFYADAGRQGPWYRADGSKQPTSANPQGGHLHVRFRNKTGPAITTTPIRNGGGTTDPWRDHKMGQTSENTTTQTNFKTFSQNTYGVNLRTSVHGVTELVLPSISKYNKVDDPSTTAEDERDNGRQIIEPASATDSAGLMETKISRKSGLYIIVNPDDQDRPGTLPDGTTVTMRARSYRCWLNRIASDLTHTITEVVLPGQPSYGALNATANLLPNQYRVDTAIGHNQVIRTIKGGGVDFADTGYNYDSDPAVTGIEVPTLSVFADSYFFDMRRAKGNVGAGSQSNTGTSRSTVPYAPRPIVKIDFDLTRFRMAVERTMLAAGNSTVYYPSLPRDAGTWAASIYNPGGAPVATNLGLALGTNNTYSVFPASESSVTAIHLSQDAAYSQPRLIIGSSFQTGAGAVTDYAAIIRIEPSYDNGVTFEPAFNVDRPGFYQSAAIEVSTTYVVPAGVTFLRVTQLAGAQALDIQFVRVVPDMEPMGISCGGGQATGRFIICETTAPSPVAASLWGAPVYTSTIDDTFISYRPTAGTTGVRVQQYQPGGTVTLVQQRIIPVVMAALTNDKFIVPSVSAVAGTYANAVTDMRVYVGGVDDTANWTITPAVTAGTVVGAMGAGRFANRYTATGMAGAAAGGIGTVNLTANRAGFTAVTRTFNLLKQSSLVGGLNAPASTGYSLSVRQAADPFQIYYTDGNPVVADNLVSTTTNNRPWFDGITVYVHSVDAELRRDADSDGNPDRIDSGVRLWNGRGPIISLDGITYPAKTGFTFCTNDAAYIVGHFNADGVINNDATSTIAFGGYSARYPDSAAERLCSVMADAVTMLSHPVFNNAAPYPQIGGWADALSANAIGTGGAVAWATTQPSGANNSDGSKTALRAAALPNLSRPGTAAAARTTKFAATTTEVSSALLVGIVPTNHNAVGLTDAAPASGANGQSSGGLHNFPRLVEDWTGALYIRGSMVAMFESRVALEPLNLGIYNPAERNWGLHESLRNVNHDLPLEPILIGARRLGFKEITKDKYESMKTTIEALPN